MGVNLARSFTGPPNPPNEVPVDNPANLPRPTPGVGIELADDTLYSIYGNIDVGDECLIMGTNTVIQGRTYPDAGLDCITSSNSTCTVSQTTASMFARNIKFQNTGSGFAAIAGGGSPADFHLMDAVVLTGGLSYLGGSMNLTLCSLQGDGIEVDFAGPGNGLGLNNCQFLHDDTGQVGIDFKTGSALGFFNSLATGYTTVSGSTAIRVVDSPAQVALEARVEDGFFLGAGTYLDGLTERDETWEFFRHVNAADSSAHITVESSPLAAVTINLPGAQAWTDVADGGVLITWAELSNAEKVSMTDADNGESTIGGPPLNQKVYKVSVTLVHERTAGGDLDIELGLSVNGADPTPDCRIRGVAGPRFTSLVLSTCVASWPWGTTLTPQVRNVDASNPANDIDFVECHMTVWE